MTLFAPAVKSSKLFSNAGAFLRVLVAASMFLACFSVADAQQYTNNKADQILRSSGRVNPSTLGMEIGIPLASYPGQMIKLKRQDISDYYETR